MLMVQFRLESYYHYQEELIEEGLRVDTKVRLFIAVRKDDKEREDIFMSYLSRGSNSISIL